MLGGIGERFLHHPVDGVFDRPGQALGGAGHLGAQLQAGRGGAGQQVLDRGVGRALVGAGGVVLLAEHPDHLAEALDRGSGAGPQVTRGLPVRVRQAGGEGQGPGAQRDQAQVVAERIVHVPCDPGAFAQPGLLGGQPLLALQPLGPLPPGPGQLPRLTPVPPHQPGQHARADRDEREPRPQHLPPRHHPRRQYGRARDHCEHRDPRPHPLLPHPQRERQPARHRRPPQVRHPQPDPHPHCHRQRDLALSHADDPT